MYMLSKSNFLTISHNKKHYNRLIFDNYWKNKSWTFFGTQCIWLMRAAASSDSVFHALCINSLTYLFTYLLTYLLT